MQQRGEKGLSTQVVPHWLEGMGTPAHVVTLRTVELHDLPAFFAHQSDAEAARMAGFASREHEAFMTHWTTRILGNPDTNTRTILFDGEVAGNIGAWTDAGHGERLVGYWVGREFWGRGVASAAVRQFLDVETRRPLTARVVKHNRGSIRVLEKCGFIRTGEDTYTPSAGEGFEEFVYARLTL